MNDIIIAILRSGTPLIYVTLAGVIAQRAGVWNLGLEGIMIIGACAAILGIMLTGSFTVAILIAIASCVLASVLLWFVIEKLKANPIIAGLGLTGLGIGGTALAVQSIYGSQASVNAPFGVPKLGPMFGAYGVLSIFVLLMPSACGCCSAARGSGSSSRPAASILSRPAVSAPTLRACGWWLSPSAACSARSAGRNSPAAACNSSHRG
jgi:ABC-type uncharacterized transport system permease subunit